MSVKYLDKSGLAHLWSKIKAYIGTVASKVSWSQSVTTGTKIATITIDGTPTDIYAPTGGGGGASPSSTTPLMDGTASTGSESDFARGDHRHPTDTTRAPINAPSFTGTVNCSAGIVAQGNVTVGGHDSAIGSSGGVGTNSSQVSLGTTAKAIANRTLTTGVWLLIGRVQVTHGSNATYAMFNISTTSADSTVEAQYYMNASYDLATDVVKVVSVTSASQTFYLNGKAGRSVNVASGKGTLTAWRLA